MNFQWLFFCFYKHKELDLALDIGDTGEGGVGRKFGGWGFVRSLLVDWPE